MHPTPVRLPDQPPVNIRLPLDFTAFCQLRHAPYRHHALLRLGESAAADRAVEHALGTLATDWCRILSSRRPARRAWQILTASIEHQALCQTSAPPTAARTLYTLLPARQADAMLLHLQHVPPHHAADLTGLDTAMHTYYLRTAQHTLDARLAPSP
ncbi:hypothetical protein [Streptomyces monomycini]|uniref:hypothetical protein n=1 Tax=Streptomyces monomycini TaxID=371720 RepID=UPI001EE9FFBA|nr:hypothetical protein [Streptomyces monomycini]